MPNFAKIALVCVIFLVSCSAGSESEYQGPLRDQAILVEGRMFAWEITQGGRDGALNTADDFHLKNEIVIPVGTRLKMQLISKDVLHGFFLPIFKLHHRLLPGEVGEETLEARRIGSFPFACSEVCGVGHGQMMGTLRVLSAEDYEQWLRERNTKTAMEPSG